MAESTTAVVRPTDLPLSKNNNELLQSQPEILFGTLRISGLPSPMVYDLPVQPDNLDDSFAEVERQSDDENSDGGCCGRFWQKSRQQKRFRTNTASKQKVRFPFFCCKNFCRCCQSHKVGTTNVIPHLLDSLEKGSKQEWGEERQDDVIYSVTLKRITHIPNNADKIPEGRLWETQKVRNIKGATLPYLVKTLCYSFVEDQGERHFLTVFLATYRSFATPQEILDLIAVQAKNLESESSELQKQIISSIVRILRTWVDRYYEEDFNDPPHYKVLKNLKTLAESFCEKGDTRAEELTDFIKLKMRAVEQDGLDKDLSKSLPILNGSPLTHNTSNNSTRTPQILEKPKPMNVESVKSFLNQLSPQKVAEQLTLIDATLFLKVVPHHCMYAVRSSKRKPATVKATIDQFNRVVYTVLAICLCPGFKQSQRVKIISKWIEVAQACRELKNFSSLRAIISGLQTHPIHRLRRMWSQVPSEYSDLLKELSQINTKDSLEKVGTAKVNTEQSAIGRVRKDASVRRQKNMYMGIMHGTVPYLGSFLTDLTFLDTAKPDFLEKNIINFDKRKKEFELLAQLQLWQVSCRSYQHIESDSQFIEWFDSVTLPTDDQAIKLSEELEPHVMSPLSPNPISPSKRSLSDAIHYFHLHRHHDQSGLSPSGNSTPNSVNRAKSAGRNELSKSLHSRDPRSGKSYENSNYSASVAEGERTVNVQIIKKNDDDIREDKGKELKLSANDRSPAFVRKAFNLFDIEDEDIHKYKIMQILPGDKRLEIPNNGNVYYAMNSTANEFNFKVVEEGANEFGSKPENCQQTPKSKKLSRKVIKPLSPSGTSSTMKNIYRHLGITGYLWANSGWYSPSKASHHTSGHQSHSREEKDNEEGMPATPPPHDLSRSNQTSSNDNNIHSSLSHQWKKLTGSEKEKRKFNFSEREIYMPLYVNESTPSPSEGEKRNSTWPRGNHYSQDSDGKSRLRRRPAVRKHYSHPRRELPITTSVTDNSLSSSISSISNFASIENSEYDTCEELSIDCITPPLRRHDSVEIMSNEVTDYSESLRRSSSDPCLLETLLTEHIFQQDKQSPTNEEPSQAPQPSSQTFHTYL